MRKIKKSKGLASQTLWPCCPHPHSLPSWEISSTSTQAAAAWCTLFPSASPRPKPALLQTQSLLQEAANGGGLVNL